MSIPIVPNGGGAKTWTGSRIRAGGGSYRPSCLIWEYSLSHKALEYRNGLGERVCAVETAAREEGLDAQRAPLSVMYEWKSRHLDSKKR